MYLFYQFSHFLVLDNWNYNWSGYGKKNYGGCSCGNSFIGGDGLQYGGQISSLIIIPLLLSSNVGGGDWCCLCFVSFPYANTFSNTVSIPEIIANAIKDVITIEFILPLVYQIFYIYFFKFQ